MFESKPHTASRACRDCPMQKAIQNRIAQEQAHYDENLKVAGESMLGDDGERFDEKLEKKLPGRTPEFITSIKTMLRRLIGSEMEDNANAQQQLSQVGQVMAATCNKPRTVAFKDIETQTIHSLKVCTSSVAYVVGEELLGDGTATTELLEHPEKTDPE